MRLSLLMPPALAQGSEETVVCVVVGRAHAEGRAELGFRLLPPTEGEVGPPQRFPDAGFLRLRSSGLLQADGSLRGIARPKQRRARREMLVREVVVGPRQSTLLSFATWLPR